MTNKYNSIRQPPVLTKCKICNSIHTRQVNDMLEKKVPQTVIVSYLKDKGLTLSAMSVSRHLHNCILGEKKQRVIQKGGILKAQKKARQNNKKTDKQRLQKNEHNIKHSAPTYNKDKNPERRRKQYLKELEDLEKDINVVNEFVFLLNAAKDRLKRGLEEEETSQLVLATTGKAIADYGTLLQKFNEMTQGMESLQSLRFAELIQMVGNIFAKTPITDRSRRDILDVVNQYIESNEDENEDEEAPISLIPSEISKFKHKM